MHITQALIFFIYFPILAFSKYRKPLRSDAARWDEFKTPSGRFIVPVVVDRRDRKSIREQIGDEFKDISEYFAKHSCIDFV